MGFWAKIATLLTKGGLNLVLNLMLNLALCAVIWVRGNEIESLKSQLNSEHKNLIIAQSDNELCKLNLALQNEKIEQMSLNLSEFKVRDLSKIEKIKPENSSCEAELKAYKKLFEAGGV